MSRQDEIMKIFAVRVCQTYVKLYQIPAKTAEEAERLVNIRLQTGEYVPANDAMTQSNVSIVATKIYP